MRLIKAKIHLLKGQCTWQFLRMEKHAYKTKQTSSTKVNQQLFHFWGGKIIATNSLASQVSAAETKMHTTLLIQEH